MKLHTSMLVLLAAQFLNNATVAQEPPRIKIEVKQIIRWLVRPVRIAYRAKCSENASEKLAWECVGFAWVAGTINGESGEWGEGLGAPRNGNGCEQDEKKIMTYKGEPMVLADFPDADKAKRSGPKMMSCSKFWDNSENRPNVGEVKFKCGQSDPEVTPRVYFGRPRYCKDENGDESQPLLMCISSKPKPTPEDCRKAQEEDVLDLAKEAERQKLQQAAAAAAAKGRGHQQGQGTRPQGP